jgi:3,4-dihydroxy-2-butanone 4-phosphate synthase
MKKMSIRGRITSINKGESITFSLNEVSYNTLRSTAYTLAIETGNTYTTKINRVDRKLTITRTA